MWFSSCHSEGLLLPPVTHRRPWCRLPYSSQPLVVSMSKFYQALASLPRRPETAVSYTYKVRIINPNRKSDVVSWYLNKYSSKFASVMAIRMLLIEEFKDQVPDSTSFQVGYFEGSQQMKIWIVTEVDLKDIHKARGQINMWCEGVSNDGATKGQSSSKRKRDESGVPKKEEDVENNFKVLQDKHDKDKQFTTPLLRLWARTISAGLHDDFDTPDLPAFSQSKPRDLINRNPCLIPLVRLLCPLFML